MVGSDRRAVVVRVVVQVWCRRRGLIRCCGPGGRGGRRAGPWSGRARAGRDPATAQADLDEVVEDALVAGSRRGCPRRRRAGAARAGPRPRCARRWRASSARTSRAYAAPAASGSPAAQRPGRGPAGQRPGGDRVVDALAGHRVDQPGGVAGQQHRGRRGGVQPAPGQRQVVAAPGGAAGGGAGQQLLELLEQQRPATAGRRRRRPARRTRRWTGRRRGRRTRRRRAGGARRSGSPAGRGAPAGWGRSRAARGRGAPVGASPVPPRTAECTPSAPTTTAGAQVRRRALPSSVGRAPRGRGGGAARRRARRPARPGGRRRPRAG